MLYTRPDSVLERAMPIEFWLVYSILALDKDRPGRITICDEPLFTSAIRAVNAQIHLCAVRVCLQLVGDRVTVNILWHFGPNTLARIQRCTRVRVPPRSVLTARMLEVAARVAVRAETALARWILTLVPDIECVWIGHGKQRSKEESTHFFSADC